MLLNVSYIGEHLWPGQVGHAALVLAFVCSLLATAAYFFAVRSRDGRPAVAWQRLGRWAFSLHGLGIFAAIGLIFYIMIQQYYEYQYVWAHVSEELPLKYIASAFWEGQEGSFLLWMFWHVVLGMAIMFTAGRWEAPVLAVVALVQAFLSSMVLGVYLWGNVKIGSNPLLLLRDTLDAPIFANADYLSLIQGNGLNPLLQNWWMTIHPPTLFLGFASTTIPFAFALAGLWTGEHKKWLQPALPWSLFSAGILGTGILMGGAWAYEALSFGGYWAWDPVENMSLVPWLILLGGIHTHLVAKATGQSIRSTYIYYVLTFALILYSTFLTRSGVLGDTSVHAFTEMGLEWQLVIFNLFFLLLGAAAIAWQYKRIPTPPKEESAGSREFWMFIGTLVLLFSAALITGSTSLPVINKIMQWFDPTYEGRVITEPIPHYNKYQIWIAVFIAFLSGASQFLRYRERRLSGRLRQLGIHLGIALLLTAGLTWLTGQWIDLYAWQYTALLFAGIFAVVSNLDHLFTFARGNAKLAGSHFSHIGFGVMIVGILASGLNQRVISSNPFVMEGIIEGADDETLRKNIMLFKGAPMIMDDYELTYEKDTLVDYTRTYTIAYKRRNERGEVVEEFELTPNVLYEKSFEKIAASNPSTKHYLHKDVFTHITSLPKVELDMSLREEKEKELNYRTVRVPAGAAATFADTVELNIQGAEQIRSYRLEHLGLNYKPTHPDYHAKAGDLALGVKLRVQRLDQDSAYTVMPVIALRGQLIYTFPSQINELNVKVRLTDEVLDALFVPEEELDYRTYTLQQGDSFAFEDYRLTFAGFNKNPSHPGYLPEEGDIAVSARVQVTGPEGAAYQAEPVYFIRDSRPYNLKAHLAEAGLHLRFTGIDPRSETVTLLVARQRPAQGGIPVQVATNSLRSDWIVMQAIEFPGINLFWLGSTLMMVGLFLSMIYRIRQKRRPQAPAQA